MQRALLTTTATAALALFAAGTASAADKPGIWYASIFGGASFPESIDYELIQSGAKCCDGHQDLKTGYLVGGAVGATFGSGWRGELELSYQRFKAGGAEYTFAGGGSSPYDDAHGHQAATFLLVNFWYDLPVSWAMRPYIGGGGGAAFVDQTIDHPAGVPFGPGGHDTAFAFQLGAGVNIPFSKAVSLDVGYRFRGIVGADIKGQQAGDVHADQDIYSHNVVAGVKVTF